MFFHCQTSLYVRVAIKCFKLGHVGCDDDDVAAVVWHLAAFSCSRQIYFHADWVVVYPGKFSHFVANLSAAQMITIL